MKLNSKQKNFCNEYIKNGANGTQAYLKAYKTKSEETATVNASRLLRSIFLSCKKKLRTKLL